MEKNFIIGMFGVSVIALLSVAAIRFPAQVTAQVVGDPAPQIQIQGGKQVVQLSFQNYNYYPDTIYLKAGVPTQVVVDTDKVRGCMTTIVIPSLGIKKTVRPEDNTIEFTPTTIGTIPFSCIMGMGKGKFIVTASGNPDSLDQSNIAVQSAAQADSPAGVQLAGQPGSQPAPVQPSSCGSGCGCGGAG